MPPTADELRDFWSRDDFFPAKLLKRLFERDWSTLHRVLLTDREFAITPGRGPSEGRVWRFQKLHDLARIGHTSSKKYDFGAVYLAPPRELRDAQQAAEKNCQDTRDGLQAATKFAGQFQTQASKRLMERLGGQLSVLEATRDIATQNRVPIGKELVMEIDLNDYDWLGIDKTQQGLLDRYFSIVQFGILLLRDLLSEMSGFVHTLAWYSGRRGAALAVLDDRAFKLSNEGRKTISGLFVPSGWGAEKLRDFAGALPADQLEEVHARTAAFADKHFDEWAEADSDNFREALRRLAEAAALPTEAHLCCCVQNTLATSSRCVWTDIKMTLSQTVQGGGGFLRALLFAAMFPRIDIAVSTDTAHLLKGPFSPHADTGRICCVFDPDVAFLPRICPTVHSLALASTSATAVARVQRSASILERVVENVPPPWKETRAAPPEAEVEAEAAPAAKRPPPAKEDAETSAKKKKKAVKKPSGVTDMRQKRTFRPFPSITFGRDRVFVRVAVYVIAKLSDDQSQVLFVAHKAVVGKPQHAVCTLKSGHMMPLTEPPPLSITRARAFSAVSAALEDAGGGGRWSAASVHKLIFVPLSREEAVRQVQAQPTGNEVQLGAIGVGPAEDRDAVDSYVSSVIFDDLARTAELLEGTFSTVLDW